MFCPNCGKERDEGNFCAGCGYNFVADTQQNYSQSNVYQTKHTIEILAEKIKISVIIWSVIAGLQIVLGFFNMFIFENITNGLIFFGIAALNIFAAYKDYQFSNTILSMPIGIVGKFQPLTSYIITLIYNLIFGGVIGVAGTIYDLTIRNYVMTNATAFLSIEEQFSKE